MGLLWPGRGCEESGQELPTFTQPMFFHLKSKDKSSKIQALEIRHSQSAVCSCVGERPF